MATVVAVALVAVSAMAAASASATVLCKASSPTYHCSSGNVYPVSTEFNAHNEFSKLTLNVGESVGALGSCTESWMRFGIPPINTNPELPETVGFNELSFSGCTQGQLIEKEITYGADIEWISGTHTGNFTPFWLLLENPNTQYGGACSYWLEGSAKLSNRFITFKKAPATFAEGSISCPRSNVSFTGSYYIAYVGGDPVAPIYVEKN